MQMTDTEILDKYNHSDDKKGMVQILADLNGCDKDTIQQILIEGGFPESDFTTKKRPGRKKNQPAGKEAPAGKPNPAEAVAVIPIGDYGSLSAGGYIPPHRYRTAEELLAEPEDMTGEEMERLKKIRAIPESVRELCQTEVENLRSQVMEFEKRSDEILDFLNGEAV